MTFLRILTAAAAAALILAATATAGLPDSARTLMAHRAGTTPSAQLGLANRTVKRARDVLGFLEANPLAGTPALRVRIRRDYSWLLRFGRSEQERARARMAAAANPEPTWWLTQAACIHLHESSDWHQRGYYRGGMQFLFSTWGSVGGRGDPADAAPAEQLYRAWLVWKRDGGSWREWGTAGACGVS